MNRVHVVRTTRAPSVGRHMVQAELSAKLHDELAGQSWRSGANPPGRADAAEASAGSAGRGEPGNVS
jgi:hypothetical protein